MGGVVRLEEVLENCAGFPEGEIGVGVVDGREAAVGVDGCVGGGFYGREGDGDGGEGKGEFVEEDDDLGGVDAAGSVEENGLEVGVGGGGGHDGVLGWNCCCLAGGRARRGG